MRTSGLLLTVLVVAGGAWAQYAGQEQQQQQQQQQYFTCAQNEVCVFWPHCYEGVVNTAGIGIINPRTPQPIPSNYTDARPCESVGKLCCLDPNKKPEPIGAVCPLHHLCVPREQCINGEINTSGIGLIDERIRPTKCTNAEYPNVDAVCCKRPDPIPLVTCPATHETCRLPSECDTASGTYNKAAVGCYVDPATGVDGVCCSPPTLQQCSRGHVCVTYEQCTEQGVVNTDGAGIFNPRIYDRCELGGGAQGICCKEPPHTNPPVVKCSQAGTVCSPTGYCQPDSLSEPQGYTETCYRTEGSGIIGECCVEAPLPECSAGYSCHLPHQCVETPGIIANNPSCQINVELVGVCCTKKEPPVQIVDVCPKDSVCLPEVLCQGNPGTNVIPKACKLSGTGYSNPGVCCTNNVVAPEIPDLECGVGNAEIATRIKNTNLLESQAKFAEFPWMGIVFFRNQTYKCGASLVDNRWVLTAAHCVAGFNPYDLRVRLGEYQVDLFDEKYPYEDYDITSITVHPNFNSANLHNDVAVLELDRPVTYRYHINRICLPTPDRVHPAGTECIATGWGKDAFDGGKYQVIMKKVVLPVVPYDTCQDMLRKTRLGLFFILDKSFVCAGGKAGQDACTGDGGGPLMCLNPGSGRYELYGMTAWGIGCGIEGNPGVYVNVPYFMDWVYGIMQPTQEQQQQHSAGPYGK